MTGRLFEVSSTHIVLTSLEIVIYTYVIRETNYRLRKKKRKISIWIDFETSCVLEFNKIVDDLLRSIYYKT